MQELKLQQWIDWLSTSLRWIILLGLALSLSFGSGHSTIVILGLLLASLWNLILTGLAFLDYRFRFYTYVLVLVDAVISLFVFNASQGLNGAIPWVGILPVISAALFFQIKDAILLAGLVMLLQVAIVSFNNSFLPIALFVSAIFPLYLGMALVTAYLIWKIKGLYPRQKVAQSEVSINERRSEKEQRRSIYKIISLMGASLNYQRVLEAALDLSIEALGTTDHVEEHLVSAVMLFDEQSDGHQLLVGSARRFTPTDMRIKITGRSGLIGQAIERGEACLSLNPAEDAELGRIVALRACNSVYCVPLRNGLDTYGVLLFGHLDNEFFSDDIRELLDIIGNQAMVAIQNARLYHELEIEKERIMEIQEEARKKLARDLHDGPTQSVSALAMRANFARRLIDRDAPKAAEELFKIEEMARKTTKEIRHMLFTLRPLVLESQGLAAALESMAEKMRDTFNQKVIIQVDAEMVSQIDIGKQGVIFYLAEEAVTNARKHAEAENIWVRLKNIGDDLAMLEIEDDGKGFDYHAASANYEQRGSMGMVNMRERAELVNGLLKIESTPGKGTRIRVVIPLSEEAADMLRQKA
jgi:signal transduction histidine kinase